MVAEDVILTFPNNIMTTIQALGGILLLYLIFGIVSNIISFRRNRKINKMIEAIHEMGKDVKDIKIFLKKKL